MEIGFDSSDVISGASHTFKEHLKRNSKLRLAVAHSKEILETATIFEWGFSARRVPKPKDDLYSDLYEDEDYSSIESASANIVHDYRITLKLGISHAYTDTGCHEIAIKQQERLQGADGNCIFASVPIGVNDKLVPDLDRINYGIQRGKLFEIAAKDSLLVVEGSFRFWAKEVDDMMVVQFSDYKKRISEQIKKIIDDPAFPAMYESFFLEKFRKNIENHLNPLKKYSPDLIRRILDEMYVKDVVNT